MVRHLGRTGRQRICQLASSLGNGVGHGVPGSFGRRTKMPPARLLRPESSRPYSSIDSISVTNLPA